jgi:hypothetical protein
MEEILYKIVINSNHPHPRPAALASPLLPRDPFHGYEGPSAFEPDTAWSTEPQEPGLPSSLDSDAEETHPPLGLLDSPPRSPFPQETPPTPNHTSPLPTAQSPTPSTTTHALANIRVAVLAPPPLALLGARGGGGGGQARKLDVRTGKRRNLWIASQPPSNAKPAVHAWDTKLKKLGFSIDTDTGKAQSKKKQ